MRLKTVFPAAVAVAILAACSDSSTITPAASVDAGALDAMTPLDAATVPPGDDDDDGADGGADADAVAPVDAGGDAEPQDAALDAKDASGTSPTHKYRVFVTKTRYSGALTLAGGDSNPLRAADNLCTKAANTAALGGGTTWTAWISTGSKNAIARLVDRAPWYLVNNTTVVFSTFGNLLTTPLHRIDVNETGNIDFMGSDPLDHRVWTGTANNGTYVGGKSCGDWAVAIPTSFGVAGTYFDFGPASNWSRHSGTPEVACDEKWPIYCFEQ